MGRSRRKGKALLEAQLEKVTFKFFRGRARAKGLLRREVQDEFQRSDALRAAVVRSLDKLQGLIHDAGKVIRAEKATDFLAWGSNGYVVAVPRALVLRDLRRCMIEDLGDSAVLGRFTGLPKVFLARKADVGEQAFSDAVGKEAPVSIHNDAALVMSVDRDFDWTIGRPPGHYYVGYSKYSMPKENKERKELTKELTAVQEKVKAQIGSLSAAEFAAFANSFEAA